MGPLGGGEADVFEDRSVYLAANGAKDVLTSSPLGWPGIGWVPAVAEGRPSTGVR